MKINIGDIINVTLDNSYTIGGVTYDNVTARTGKVARIMPGVAGAYGDSYYTETGTRLDFGSEHQVITVLAGAIAPGEYVRHTGATKTPFAHKHPIMIVREVQDGLVWVVGDKHPYDADNLEVVPTPGKLVRLNATMKRLQYKHNAF